MRFANTITFALPASLGRTAEKIAKQENKTVGELVGEALRQYQALGIYEKLAAKTRRIAKKKGLTEKDFGGPFAK